MTDDYDYQLKAEVVPGSDWVSVTKEEWIKAERAAGFRPTLWSGHPEYMTTCATGGFSNSQGISGRLVRAVPATDHVMGSDPRAYLVEWFDNGERRRVQLDKKLEPWVSNCGPTVLPLYAAYPTEPLVLAARAAVEELRRLHRMHGVHYEGKNGAPNTSVADALEAALSAPEAEG